MEFGGSRTGNRMTICRSDDQPDPVLSPRSRRERFLLGGW